MFSTTTTSASISIPIAIARPPRLIRLADMPTARMTIRAMTIASGKLSAITSDGAPVAEEEQQQDDDQDGRFGQRPHDGADGAADQPARDRRTR